MENSLPTRACADGYIAGVSMVHHIGCDATCPVAGDFRFTAVSIDQLGANVGISGRKEPFHTVSTHPVVAVANAFAELMQVGRSIGSIPVQEVISASGGFGERDLHLVEIRSRCGFKVTQVS
jgi:hypothetical protein